MAIDNQLSLGEVREALAQQGDPWEAGVTSISVLMPDEQQQRLGVKPPPGEPSIHEVAGRAKQALQTLRALALERAVGAPAEFDSRNIGGSNFVTPVTDQKQCGSCVAFATVAAVEGRLRRQ